MYLMLPILSTIQSKINRQCLYPSLARMLLFWILYTMYLSIGVAESHPEYIESIEIYVPCRSVYHMHCLSLLNVVI